MIEEELNIKVSNDEKGYIAMHIERLKNISNYKENKLLEK
jgi:transcriptional antiterminator